MISWATPRPPLFTLGFFVSYAPHSYFTFPTCPSPQHHHCGYKICLRQYTSSSSPDQCSPSLNYLLFVLVWCLGSLSDESAEVVEFNGIVLITWNEDIFMTGKGYTQKC